MAVVMPETPKERGILAERYVREFLSLPFISEFVFHSPQTPDGSIQKEVGDMLIAYPGVVLYGRLVPNSDDLVSS